MEAPKYTLMRTWLWRNFVVFVSLALLLQVVEVKSHPDIDALMTLKNAMVDPKNCFRDWDPNLVDPCTWLHITCNSNNRVTRLDVANYDLTGQLPSSLVGLDQVEYVNLFLNNISESIPVEYGHNFKNLISLDLDSNSLTGTIPASLGELPALKFLRLEQNQLTGEIPKELGSMPSLVLLNISSNNLCGDVPPIVARIPSVDWSNNPGLGKPCP